MWRGRICSLDSMAELVVDDCCNFYMLFLLVLGFFCKNENGAAKEGCLVDI